MYNDEYESFTMFALDLERGMFCSHLKKKTNFDLLSFAMFKDSNDYLNLKYKLKKTALKKKEKQSHRNHNKPQSQHFIN